MSSSATPARLFVYGTLHPRHQPGPVRRWAPPMEPVGPASVRGSMYDLGHFPGLVLDDAAGQVHGEVFTLADDPGVWSKLDWYEGFQPQRPEQSLFRRMRCTVALEAGGQVECWTYVYNRDIRGVPIVTEGRWKGLAVP